MPHDPDASTEAESAELLAFIFPRRKFVAVEDLPQWTPETREEWKRVYEAAGKVSDNAPARVDPAVGDGLQGKVRCGRIHPKPDLR